MKGMILGFGVSLMSAFPAFADAAKPTGDEIMKKVTDRKFPDSSYARVELSIKKGDATVEKVFKAWAMKISDDESHTLIEFEKPNNQKILAYTRRNGEDDRWIKTSTGSPKRIASGGDNQAFAQSHFTFSDMDFSRAKGFKNELLCDGAKCEIDYKGAPHYKVKSTPAKADNDYAYVINYVRISDNIGVKVEYFTKDGKLVKELIIDEIKDVDGYKTPTLITMKMAEPGESSTLKITEIEVNSKKVNKQMFDKNLL